MGAGDDAERELRQALRHLGEEYHPDRAHVLARVEAGMDSRPARWAPAGIAGAVAATVLVAAVLVNQTGGSVPGPARTVATETGSEVTTSSTLSWRTSATRPTTGVTTVRSSPAVRPTSRRTTEGAKDADDAAVGPVDATTVALPPTLDLPRAGDRDWVVTGARNDDKVIRMKAGTGTVSLPEDVTGAADPQPAPVAVNWTGGYTEQDRTDNTTWWAAPAARTVFRFTLSTVDRPSTLAVYTGGAAADVRVRAVFSGAGTTTTTVDVPRSQPGGAVVLTLTDQAVGGRLSVEIGASSWSSGGKVALAAVVLR
ncbi:MAG: hypothetical protein GXX79_22165 [Actinomycetales bacterium]|nr:hypothetical protein [Actinomycetales bacterium]